MFSQSDQNGVYSRQFEFQFEQKFKQPFYHSVSESMNWMFKFYQEYHYFNLVVFSLHYIQYNAIYFFMLRYELLDPRKKARLVNFNFIFFLLSRFSAPFSRIAHELQITVKMTMVAIPHPHISVAHIQLQLYTEAYVKQ